MADYLETLIGQVARTMAEEEEQEDYLQTIINEVVNPPKPKSSDPDPAPVAPVEPEATPDTPEFKPKLFGPKAPASTTPIAAPDPSEGMSLREWVAAGNDPEAHPEFTTLEKFTSRKPTPALQTEVDRLEKSQSAAVRVPKKILQSAGQYFAGIFRAAEGLAEQREASSDTEAMEAITDRAPKDRFSFEYREFVKEHGETPEKKDRGANQANVADDIPEVQDWARQFHKDNNRMPTNKEIRATRTLAYDNEIKRNLENARAVIEMFPEVDKETSGFLEDTLVGVSRYLPHIALTIATGGTASFPVLLASLTGDEYTKFKDEGLDTKTAWKYGTMSAAAQAILEQGGTVFSLGKLGKFFKGEAKGIWNKAVRTITQVSAAEGTEEGLQDVSSKFFLELAKSKGDIVTATKATTDFYKTPEGLKQLGKSVAGGAVGGPMLAGGPVIIGAGIKSVKNIAAPATEEQNLIARNKLIEKEDFDAENSTGLQYGMDDQAVENQQDKISEVAKATKENQDEAHQTQIEQAEKEVQEAQQAEQQNKQAAAEQASKIKAAKTKFVKTLEDPIAVMEIAADMDVKPINDAHKALSTGEDSIKKLKGIKYDLKHGKELKDQPFEVEAVATALQAAIDEDIKDLSIFAAADTQAQEAEKAEKEAEKTAKANEREAEKAKKETEKVIDETVKEQESLIGEIEKVSEQFEKEQEAIEAKTKAKEEKAKPSFNYRRKSQRKAAGISETKGKSLDQAFAEQRRKAAEKHEAAPKKPADLKAALRFSDGTVLVGNSHFDIINNLTEAQHEEIAKQTVERGFDSKQGGFKSVEDSTTAYGVTKSEQLKLKTTGKLFIEKAEKLGKKVKDKKQLKEQIEQRIAKKAKKLNLGNMKVVETLDDLKGVTSEKQLAELKDLDAVAFYDPNTKTSYIIADQHKTLVSGLVSAWHELGHQKLDELAKATEVDLKPVWDAVAKQNPEQMKELMDRGLDKNRAAEEILIETYEATKNPTIVSKVKAALSKIADRLGFPVNEMGKLDGIIDTMKTAIRSVAGAPSTELKGQFLSAAERFDMGGPKTTTLAEAVKASPLTDKTGVAKRPRNFEHPIRPSMRKRGTLDKNQVAFIESFRESMPAAYKEHFGVLFSDKAGTSMVQLKKMGELKQDAKHIVTMYKDGDVGHFLEEFGYFAARRLLKKGEAKGLYNEWLKTKPKDVKKPKDWQRWFATSYSEWYLGHNSAPTKGLTKAFQKITQVAKAIYLRLKGYNTKQTEVQSMFEDITTGSRDIVSDKYFYSDKDIMDRYLFGVDPSPKDMSTQGFSKNNKTHISYDPGNICPKTQAFADWLFKEFEKKSVTLEDLVEESIWVELTNQARMEGIDVPCSYCYVEQGRRAAVVLHNQNSPKTRVDYEKVKTMVTAIPYTDYLLQKNTKGKNKGEYVFSDAAVAEANQRGGLRMFSFSDYIKGAHRVQIELLMEHAKKRGLSVKAITKRPEFVEDFAHTGITINVSIDTEGTGMDHGIAYALAKKYPNVHVRTVAKNPADFERLGNDKKIGIITLFHGTKAQTPEGYENMSYKSVSVKEILAKKPELRNKTCCLNEAKCFNGKKDTQCMANCGNGMGNLSIPELLTGEEAKAHVQAIKDANLIKAPSVATDATIPETEGTESLKPKIGQPVTAGAAIFPDSVVQSEVYHGTGEKFDKFTQKDDHFVFFSENRKHAERFTPEGGEVQAAQLNIQKPFDPKNKKDVADMADLIEKNHKEYFDKFIAENQEDVEDYTEEYNTDPVGFIKKILNFNDGFIVMEHPSFRKALRDRGFDAVITYEFDSKNYGVFDANQIETVDELEPLKLSMRKSVKDQVTPKQWQKLKHLGIQKKSFGQKVASTFENLGVKIAEALADPLARLKDLQDKKGGIKSGEDSYLSFNMITNFTAIFRSFLHDGRLDWKNNWVQYNKADKDVGGLMNVFENLGPDAEMFMYRMMGKSAQEMLDKGRKNLFGTDGQGKDLNDQEVIDNLMESTDKMEAANKKEWKKAEDRLKEINKSVLDIMEKGNLINAETRQEWERETYVPFFRVMDDIKGTDIMILHPGTPAKIKGIHKLAGGRENVADPMSNLLGAYAQGIHAALKNTSRLKAIKLLNDMGLAEPTTEQAGPLVVDVKIKGKTHYWHVHDKLAFNAIMSMDDMTQGAFSAIVTAPKRWLTFAVTQNPAFRLANWFRDSITTATLEKEFIPIWDSFIGMYHAAFNTETLKEYKSTGGAFTGAYHQRDILSSSSKGIASLRKEALRGKRTTPFKKGDVKGIIKQVLNPMSYLDLYNKMGDVSENAARVGLYRKKRKAGLTAQQAGFAAKDLLDFHRSSSNKMLRTLIHTVPFLNARIQGLYKLGREGTNTKKGKMHLANFYLTAAMIGFLSIGNHLLYRDDERYQALTDDEKWYYFHFYDLPGIPGHVQIPSPFEIGTLAGKAPVVLWERLIEQRTDNEEVKRFLTFAAMDMFGFNPLPQAVKPIVQQSQNRDFFTDAPIVPRRLQGIDPDLVHDRRTSVTARALGKAAEAAGLPEAWQEPIRIEKLFKDYFSYLGVATFQGVDLAYDWITNAPDDPLDKETIKYLTGVGRFYKGTGPAKRTKYDEKFWDLATAVDKAHKSLNHVKKENGFQAQSSYRRKHKHLLDAKFKTEFVKLRLRTLKTQENRIYNSTKPVTQKRKELDILQRKRNELMRTNVEKINKLMAKRKEKMDANQK